MYLLFFCNMTIWLQIVKSCQIMSKDLIELALLAQMLQVLPRPRMRGRCQCCERNTHPYYRTRDTSRCSCLYGPYYGAAAEFNVHAVETVHRFWLHPYLRFKRFDKLFAHIWPTVALAGLLLLQTRAENLLQIMRQSGTLVTQQEHFLLGPTKKASFNGRKFEQSIRGFKG